MSLAIQAPRRATPMLLAKLAPVFLPPGRRLFVADGANSFDPYAFAIEARRRGLREDVLDRVFVTRCFTIHQLAAVTAGMMRPLPRQVPGAAIVVLGLDHLFLEESLRAQERARVLRGVLGDLAAMQGEGARLMVTHEPVPAREAWWRPLAEFGDLRLEVFPDPDSAQWNLRIERQRDGADASYLQYLASGGDRLLEGLPPRPEG
jgi:hypothetical protein